MVTQIMNALSFVALPSVSIYTTWFILLKQWLMTYSKIFLPNQRQTHDSTEYAIFPVSFFKIILQSEISKERI